MPLPGRYHCLMLSAALPAHEMLIAEKADCCAASPPASQSCAFPWRTQYSQDPGTQGAMMQAASGSGCLCQWETFWTCGCN